MGGVSNNWILKGKDSVWFTECRSRDASESGVSHWKAENSLLSRPFPLSERLRWNLGNVPPAVEEVVQQGYEAFPHIQITKIRRNTKN